MGVGGEVMNDGAGVLFFRGNNPPSSPHEKDTISLLIGGKNA